MISSRVSEVVQLDSEQPTQGTVVHCIDLVDARQHEGHHFPLSSFRGQQMSLTSELPPSEVVDLIRKKWPSDTPKGDALRIYTENRHVYVTLGADEWAKAQLQFALNLR